MTFTGSDTFLDMKGREVRKGDYFVKVFDNLVAVHQGLRVNSGKQDMVWVQHTRVSNEKESTANSVTLLRDIALLVPREIVALGQPSVVAYLRLEGVEVLDGYPL